MPDIGLAREWHSVFSPEELTALTTAIPEGISAAHARTSRAHTEYDDPDGERDVYGVGMSKAAPKEIRSRLATLPSYEDHKIPQTSRRLMYVGKAFVFPLRVGAKMPRNTNQIRLRSLSASRQRYFGAASTLRTAPLDVTLFDDTPLDEPSDDNASLADALDLLEDARRRELFVAFYSSSPLGVGQIMWAPARLSGRYLQFVEPETLTYRKMPGVPSETETAPQRVQTFGASKRPTAPVKLRKLPPRGSGSDKE
ncbi:hypothetical protein GW571_13960 [Clavibacter capsici]|uniref:hypothetical protein n=1 Tax=Clavibacter capsici TaxID=1874630 RepID=UPI00142846CD|nr:hypothetical protein [Clavibacter capsici]QIS43152.1 hypothetical protein GW571_13960 [Clavibacter capsici]